jgi:L-alanine-DL-glutamate epimerase-like enolase superfamily enzyme
VSAGGTYARFAGLGLEIEGYALERLEKPVTRGFTRVTTLVRLRGGREEGIGEDVTWYAEHHDREQAAGPILPLAGSWTLESFSEGLEIIPDPHRRWAYESSALDLALRQAGKTLAELVGREPKSVAFVVSPGLGDPPTARTVRRWLELDPSLRFKLDPGSAWTNELISELAATHAVVTADYKGFYTEQDPPPDADLYRRVAEGFPEAYLEDPALTDETELVLEPHKERVTWDAPVHSVADVEQLPFPPRVLNSKPSRFGRLSELLRFYDHCEERGIGLYGGGMFELGTGRGQIQYLASLFHPDGPNDVAPGAYNDPEPRAGLPSSPLKPDLEPAGFRWAQDSGTL